MPSSSSSLSSPPPLLPLSSWPLPCCYHHGSRSRHRPHFLLCLPYNGAGSRVMLALAPDLMQALIARFSRMIAYHDRSKCVRLISLTSPYQRHHLIVPVDIHHAPPFFTSMFVRCRGHRFGAFCASGRCPSHSLCGVRALFAGPDLLRIAQDYFARWKMSVRWVRKLRGPQIKRGWVFSLVPGPWWRAPS
jgi:hypothetical protein